MKRWITMLLLVSMLITLGGVRPALAAGDEFERFFEQSAFLPTDFNDQMYAGGSLYVVNEPVVVKNDVVYVSSLMLQRILGNDYYHLMSDGARGSDGTIVFVPSEPGQHAWGYAEGDPTAFRAWTDQTRCTVKDQEKRLAHAPYLLQQGNKSYAMLPLADVCQVLELSYTQVDGLVIVSQQKPQAQWLTKQKEMLAHIKEQLSRPFAGENDNYLLKDIGGNVTVKGSDGRHSWSQIANYEHPNQVYQAQESAGTYYTEEATTDILLKDLISGQSDVFVTLPNADAGTDEQGRAQYRSHALKDHIAVPGGHILTTVYSGSTAQSYAEHMFYVTSDKQVLELHDRNGGSYGDRAVTEQAFYYTTRYREAVIGGQSGRLYRYAWGDAALTEIGQEDLNYRQMAYVGDDTLIVAASAFGVPETIQLYALDTTTGVQKLLTETDVAPLTVDEREQYFQVSGGEICYYEATTQKLHVQQIDGSNSRTITLAPMRKTMQPVTGGFSFVGADGHLYVLPIGAKSVTDLSRCVIEHCVSDGERLFYNNSGHEAGVYVWEKGQTTKILSGQIKDMQLDGYSALVILPREKAEHYYVYDQGELGKMRL